VIDFVRWTFGDVVDASARLRTTIAERPDADGNTHPCSAEDGFTATLRTDQDASITIDSTATSTVDRPLRVTVIGSDGVLELLSESVHEIGGTILLHTGHGTSEVFRMDSWADPTSHDDSAMKPWARSVRDAVRNGEAEPWMPTFSDGLACARVMDELTGPR
jgi:predicted dehydrogenase